MLYFDTIKQLVEEIPQSTGAILVDHHGDEIITYAPENDYQMKLLGAHMVLIHQRLSNIEKRLGTGRHRDIFIRTDDVYIITTPLEDNTYLVLRLTPTPMISFSISKLHQAIVNIIKEGR